MIVTASENPGPAVEGVLERVRAHAFHPVDDASFTTDRGSGRHGIGDLDDPDWRVRLLAVRDLVRAGPAAVQEIAAGLRDEDVQVRYVAATALGILRGRKAVDALEDVVRRDSDALARSPAVVALGEMESERSLELLRERQRNDPSQEVRHQAELAIHQIERRLGATEALRRAYAELDPADFSRVRPGQAAPDFALADTEGNMWQLGRANEDRWVVLIWIFAHWCPLCHGEFEELIELRREFEAAGVAVATLECHDLYRARVMVGEELEPHYWFAEHSFRDTYQRGIWWPHLLDRAGGVGARWGVDPMALAVHAEYINRPATVIIDPQGTIRLACFGTFWGDRPSIEQTLEMIRSERFDFEHPERSRA